MRKLAAAMIAGTALVASMPAFAADIVEDPAYDWCGVYAGVAAGIGHTSSDWDGVDDDVSFASVDVDESLDDTAFALSGLIGTNLYCDKLVLGVEGDLTWFDSDEEERLDGAEGLDIKSEVNFLGTIRGRAGYAVDRTLFYLTGGVAYADTKHSWDDDGGSVDMPLKKVHLKWGYVLGAGIEHAWTDDLLVRIEGFYIDLGSKSRDVDTGQGERDSFDVGQELLLGRIGLSLKLN
jgi:outer membrane immunogenic protein